MERIRDVREIAQRSMAKLGAEGFSESVTWLPCMMFIFFMWPNCWRSFFPLLFESSNRERMTASTLCRVHKAWGCIPWRFAEAWMSPLCWNSRRWSADRGNMGAEDAYTQTICMCYRFGTEETGAQAVCERFFVMFSRIWWLACFLNSACK